MGRSKMYLFSDAGITSLRAFVDRTTLFAFDLDGTLAPMAAHPGSIVIPGDVRSRLVNLNRIAPLAIITGRSREDALAHLGFSPGLLVGNHGAEGLPGCEALEEEYYRLCRGWKDQLNSALSNMDDTGIIMEDKGATLSLHYRRARDQERAHKEILAAINRLTPPPRSVSGRLVENIVPQDAPSKGGALQFIMQYLGCTGALFIGDDETDEDVFRLRDASILGIRVGMYKQSAARYFLYGQDEIVALLDRVLETVVLD